METNTFSATSIAMADYHLEEVVHDLNVASARLAREAADEAMHIDPSRPRLLQVLLVQPIGQHHFPQM